MKPTLISILILAVSSTLLTLVPRADAAPQLAAAKRAKPATGVPFHIPVISRKHPVSTPKRIKRALAKHEKRMQRLAAKLANGSIVRDVSDIPISALHDVSFLESNITTKKTTPTDLSITDYANDNEWIGKIGIGTPPQTFLVDFDTGSADLWITSTLCILADCAQHHQFNPILSTSFSAAPNTHFEIDYGDGSSSDGFFASDTLTIGPKLVVKRQEFGMTANESQVFLNDVVDGVFGLAYDIVSVQPNMTTPFTNMMKQKLLPQNVFGVRLRKESQGGGGDYTFGGTNTSQYDLTTLRYTPVTHQAYWQIAITGLSFPTTYRSASLNFTGQGMVDTGTTILVVPTAAGQAIHSLIPGATWISQVQAWALPCVYAQQPPGPAPVPKAPTGNNTVAKIDWKEAWESVVLANATGAWTSDEWKAAWQAKVVGLQIGGGWFTIPLSDLVREPAYGTQCWSGIAVSSDSLWILGGTFLKNVYVIFDRDNNQVGIANPIG